MNAQQLQIWIARLLKQTGPMYFTSDEPLGLLQFAAIRLEGEPNKIRHRVHSAVNTLERNRILVKSYKNSKGEDIDPPNDDDDANWIGSRPRLIVQHIDHIETFTNSSERSYPEYGLELLTNSPALLTYGVSVTDQTALIEQSLGRQNTISFIFSQYSRKIRVGIADSYRDRSPQVMIGRGRYEIKVWTQSANADELRLGIAVDDINALVSRTHAELRFSKSGDVLIFDRSTNGSELSRNNLPAHDILSALSTPRTARLSDFSSQTDLAFAPVPSNGACRATSFILRLSKTMTIGVTA